MLRPACPNILNFYVTFISAAHSLDTINSAILKADKETVLKMLKSPHLGIKNVKDENVDHYVVKLEEAVEVKKVVHSFELPLKAN